MRSLMMYWAVAATVCGLAIEPAEAGGRWWWRRSGCSDPYTTYYSTDYSQASSGSAPTMNCLTGTTTELQIVFVSVPATELRTICTTEYRDEVRSRVVTGCKNVPVTEERVRVNTVMIPVTERKLVEYTRQVPVQTEESKSYVVKVPVWTDQPEAYTVKTPVLREADEQYTVKVPVLKDVAFHYTVNVPQTVTRTVNRTVSNVVPVVRTRSIDICVPVTQTKSVAVDRGHWENQFVEVAAGWQNSQRVEQCRVWVPNVINEDVTEVVQKRQTTQVEYLVYEQHYSSVPHDCVCIEYRPEQRQGTKKEVVYQDQVRTRMRTVVDYIDEPRSRIKKVLTFREEQRTETYPVISYRPEKLSREVSYTVYVPETKTETYTVTRMDQVADHRIENYTVRVPVPAVKQVEVRVTRMIPKVVSVTVNPCCASGQSGQLTVVPATNEVQLAAAPVLCCGAQAE